MKIYQLFILFGFLVSCTMNYKSNRFEKDNHRQQSTDDSQRKFKNMNRVYSNNRRLDSNAQSNLLMDLDVLIIEQNDTLFVDYLVASQNFLNTNGDSTVFAGYFFEKDVIDNEVTFSILNFNENYFKDTPFVYSLKLKFSENMDTLYWEMLERVARLPKKDTLLKSLDPFYE